MMNHLGKVLAIGILLLGGCATNRMVVKEVTADGSSLEVTQKTSSTWGSKTDEGAGDFSYEGIAEDGASFKMKAGAAVKGQQAGDPSTTILGVVKMLTELSRLLYGPGSGVPEAEVPLPPESAPPLVIPPPLGLRLLEE